MRNRRKLWSRWRYGPHRAGFSLVEVVFCMAILALLGIAVLNSIVYTRQSMELEKQRLAAINYARQIIEAAETPSSIPAGKVTLVPFNAPGLEIQADLAAEFYALKDDGTVDWSACYSDPPGGKPAFCRVSVSWTPPGSRSRPQKITMSTIVRAGTT